MSETSKVLIVIDDGEVRIHHTPGVDVVCIVDGENMQLPIDWTGKLIYQITHQMPITVGFDQMFCEPDDDSNVILEEGIFVVEEETSVSLQPPSGARPSMMKALEEKPPLLTGPSVDELIGDDVPTKPILMKAPWCPDCGDNHPSDIDCDGLSTDGG